MEIIKNSVWLFSGVDGLKDGRYRVLRCFFQIRQILIFNLDSQSPLGKPILFTIGRFEGLTKNNQISPSTFELPAFNHLDENHIKETHLKRMNEKFSIIEPLVEDEKFLIDYSSNQRSSALARYSRLINVDRKSISRHLSQFWRYGQSLNALMPHYSNSGSRGKDRVPKKPLGAPKQSRTLAISKGPNFKLLDSDKKKIFNILKKYYLKPDGVGLSNAYRKLLREKYSEEIRLANAVGKMPDIPSERQFRYWAKKLISGKALIKSKTTENDYLRNYRGVTGSVVDTSTLPGSRFEIDATVADVHIISELSERYVLGRPTIYVVVDRASRMIAGLHVSLYHASWRAARQALANCFTPKSEFCSRFDVNIEDSEWPCHHVPERLVCDNGEMIGLKPQEAVATFTQLEFTPPYRPDCKGVVEKRFDILNKDILHELSGTTRGGRVIRGQKDPRKDAMYTLKQVTRLLIQSVLEHNRMIFKELSLTNSSLIQHDRCFSR